MFTIGWIGSPATATYLQEVQSVLREVCRDGKARLVAVGAGPLVLDEVPLEMKLWSEETDAALRQRMAQAGRKMVEEHYSLAVVGPKLARLLKEAVLQQERQVT